MQILYLAAHAGVAVDPNDVAAIGRPQSSRHQNTSAPTRPVTIASPPCLQPDLKAL